MGAKRHNPSRNDMKEVWLALLACNIARVLPQSFFEPQAVR